MKFRKSTLPSPKMELLSRRSSGDRLSTLKRSRSFRASLKLMSKLRTHANLRLNAGFDLSPASARDQRDRKRPGKQLSLVEESSSPARNTETQGSIKDPSKDPRRSGNGPPEGGTRRSTSENELESQKISKELKSKLCLTDRIMRKSRKDPEKTTKPATNPMSPKVAHIFRWKSCEETRNSSCCDRKDACRPNRVSYENPTFCLDSSLDSSVSSFLFEPGSLDRFNEGDSKDDSPVNTAQDPGLTVLVDSQRSCEDKFVYRRDCDRPLMVGSKARSLSVNDVVLQDEGGAVSLDLNIDTFDSLITVEDLERKSPDVVGKATVCSSRSCRIRTVDNFANFWSNARGGSFRSKVTVGRKKSIKDPRDRPAVGQDRILVATTSGTSTDLQQVL